jgi:hypothetical protein
MSGRAKVIGLGAIVLVIAGTAYVLIAGEPPAEETEAVAQPAAPPSAPPTSAAPVESPRAPQAQPPPRLPEPQAAAPATQPAGRPDGAPTPEPVMPSTAPPRTTPITAAAYQAEQMKTLRTLVETEPEKAIAMARQANRRFPKSPDAAERSWIVVKGLANLKRFPEARDEAKAMVQKYPDNQFARDAERHLMVYPLGQPSREQMQEQNRQQQPQR